MLSYFLYSYGADSVGMCRCHEESESILLVDFERATLVRFVRSFWRACYRRTETAYPIRTLFPFSEMKGR